MKQTAMILVVLGIQQLLRATPSMANGLFTCTVLEESSERSGEVRYEDKSESQLKDLGAEAKGAAEEASVFFHQQNLLEVFTMERLLAEGMNYRTARNFREGIVKSDFGKLSTKKQWLMGENQESLELLSALQLKGNGPLSKLLSKLNNGKPFINPNIPIETLREIFKKAFFAPGYFHEFPGMRQAEREFLDGKISETDFYEQIVTMYGHNGPGDPGYTANGKATFWAGIAPAIKGQIADLVSKGELPQIANSFFEKTIFEQADGSLKAHEPIHYLGAKHMIEDRFDGYKDSRKIREEVSFMPPLRAEIDMLFGSNYEGTLLSMVYDREVLAVRMFQEGLITAREKDRLQDAASERERDIESLYEFYSQKIGNLSEVKQTLEDPTGPDRVILKIQRSDGRTEEVVFNKSEVGSSSTSKAGSLRSLFDSNVRIPGIQSLR